MSYHPVFDNTFFGANPTLFIPTFRSLHKSTLSVNEATSHRLGGEKPGEQEACEKLRARKAELRKLADDDIIKYDEQHAANLLSRPSLTMFADHDIVITAVAHMQPHHHSISYQHHQIYFLPPQMMQSHMSTCKALAATSHAHQVVVNTMTLNEGNGKG
jgi:hypothetical protein